MPVNVSFVKEELKPATGIKQVQMQVSIQARQPAASQIMLTASAASMDEDGQVVQRARAQKEYVMGLLSSQQKASLLDILQTIWDEAVEKLV